MSEKKFVGRNVAITLGIICVILATGLVGAVINYTSIINEKGSIIADKDSEIASLNLQIAEKDDIISSLNSQLQTLTNQKNQLQKWLEGNLTLLDTLIEERDKLSAWLDGNRTLLIKTQEWLQGNITYYNSQIDSLNAQIANLQSEVESLNVQIESLNAQITTLEGQIATLQALYQEYVNAYQKLREKINHRWNHANVEAFITPRDQAVRDIVYSITGGWSEPSDWSEFWSDIKAMYNWVVNNIEYRYDGLYPILPSDPSEELDFWDEMWQFPNETLALRKGDCEDQAILLCSMIRCYTNEQYDIEVILILSSTSGHAAVQTPFSEYKLVILDPAGQYYSHDFWGNIAFRDITEEINNWLNYWKPWMGEDVYVHRVFSDYIDMIFASTEEYIAWMYSR